MSITYLIIFSTAVISYMASQKQDLLQRLIMHPYTVYHNKQYYRLVTSGFIHNGLIHFIFNMLAMYFFGPYIESIFKELYPSAGSILFIVFYLTGLIVSDLTTLVKQKDNPQYFSLLKL